MAGDLAQRQAVAELGSQARVGGHDTDRIKAFAAEFDPQPFHLDEAAAREIVFGSLAASGWHTAALTMRLLTESEFRPAGGTSAAASTSCAGRVRCAPETNCVSK